MYGNGRIDRPLVIAVAGTRGGVGSTSLAVNLGCTLAQNTHQAVALIDLDLALGDANAALSLPADHTLADIAFNIERADAAFLHRCLSKHPSGLSLLPHPVQMEDVDFIRKEHIEYVIKLLRISHANVILDLSKSFTPVDMAGLRMADVILLVSRLEDTSIHNTLRILTTLAVGREHYNEVRVVLNRIGSKADMDVNTAEETLGVPIFWQVPDDAVTMRASRRAGVPLLQYAPESTVQQSIAGLMRALEPP